MSNDAEHKLYAPLVALMRDRGYDVYREFSMLLPASDAGRMIDVIGFRWDDAGDLDAWALEAKRGNRVADVLSALPQALEYSVGVPRVSIASEASGGLLAHAADALGCLGIGYVEARRGSANEVSAPKPSGRLDRATYVRTLRHAGAILLFAPELRRRLGREDLRVHSGVTRVSRPRSARDRSTDELRWGFAFHNIGEVQVMVHVDTATRRVHACAWVEAKGALRHIWTGLTVDRLRDALKPSPSGWLVAPRVRVVRRLGPASEAARRLACSDEDLESNLVWARRLAGRKGVSPIIDVSVDLWGYDESPSKVEVTAALSLALDRLLPVYRELQALLAEGRMRAHPRSHRARLAVEALAREAAPRG